jgi:hypothetical protein
MEGRRAEAGKAVAQPSSGTVFQRIASCGRNGSQLARTRDQPERPQQYLVICEADLPLPAIPRHWRRFGPCLKRMKQGPFDPTALQWGEEPLTNADYRSDA